MLHMHHQDKDQKEKKHQYNVTLFIFFRYLEPGGCRWHWFWIFPIFLLQFGADLECIYWFQVRLLLTVIHLYIQSKSCIISQQ